MTLNPREFTILEHESGLHDDYPKIYCPLCKDKFETKRWEI